MVEKYSIYWTPRAKQNVTAIFNYLARVESYERANYVVTGIAEKAAETANFPAKHPKEPFINRSNVRFAVKWSYKIVFQIKGDTVRILNVFHTAQHPNKMKP